MNRPTGRPPAWTSWKRPCTPGRKYDRVRRAAEQRDPGRAAGGRATGLAPGLSGRLAAATVRGQARLHEVPDVDQPAVRVRPAVDRPSESGAPLPLATACPGHRQAPGGPGRQRPAVQLPRGTGPVLAGPPG